MATIARGVSFQRQWEIDTDAILADVQRLIRAGRAQDANRALANLRQSMDVTREERAELVRRRAQARQR